MTLPVLSRTWRFQVNQNKTAQGSAPTTNAALMLAVKDALLGTGSWTDSAGSASAAAANWTVRGSSNATAAAMDAVDRWTAANAIIWRHTSQARSWIVLRQTGIASQFELLIDCNNNDAANPTANTWRGALYISPGAGFGVANGGTDGSTTARPTATDELTMLGPGGIWGGAGTTLTDGDVNTRLHVMRTTDGRSTRVLFSRNNQTTGLWLIERPDNPVTNWTNPSYSMCTCNGVLIPASTQLPYSSVAQNAFGVGRGNSAMTMFLTCESVRPATSFITERMTTANDISGLYPMLPIGLYSATASNIGRHGTLADLYWALGGLPDTTTYPLDATKRFVQCGALVLPWNRSVPLFA